MFISSSSAHRTAGTKVGNLLYIIQEVRLVLRMLFGSIQLTLENLRKMLENTRIIYFFSSSSKGGVNNPLKLGVLLFGFYFL